MDAFCGRNRAVPETGYELRHRKSGTMKEERLGANVHSAFSKHRAETNGASGDSDECAGLWRDERGREIQVLDTYDERERAWRSVGVGGGGAASGTGDGIEERIQHEEGVGADRVVAARKRRTGKRGVRVFEGRGEFLEHGVSGIGSAAVADVSGEGGSRDGELERQRLATWQGTRKNLESVIGTLFFG